LRVGEALEMKDDFERALRDYEKKYGLEKAAEIQTQFDQLKEKVIADNEHVLEWLPLRKKNETIESLLQGVYKKLMGRIEKGDSA
jgi:diadenosine tetraphosphatase ApaH/serine/threonine PP2A family protein phosphatase